MTKTQMLNYAALVDDVVSTLCDTLDFEEGDKTDQDLNALTELAMALRQAAGERNEPTRN